MSMVHTAWMGNYPLLLIPDVIWTAIQQGYAHRCDILVGLPVQEHNVSRPLQLTVGINKTVINELRICWEVQRGRSFNLHSQFSTSGPQERAVANLSLMHSALDYDYVCVPTYGIPTITVTGTLVLDQFISAASGECDIKFWKSIYHCYADKTPTTFSPNGWILHCFHSTRSKGIYVRSTYMLE